MCLQDHARRSFGQDPEKASCEIFLVLARFFKDLYKTHHIQERAKECYKQSQDPGYFAKIHQEYLSITCMINQDHYCLAR
jgi:hypothetical protein